MTGRATLVLVAVFACNPTLAIAKPAKHTLTGDLRVAGAVSGVTPDGKTGSIVDWIRYYEQLAKDKAGGATGDATTVCNGIRGVGHGDIRQGASVVVKNEAGTIIATGALGAPEFDCSTKDRLTSCWCAYPFVIENLPSARFYTIGIAGRAGDQTHSREDLEKKKWHVDYSLGM